MVGARSWGWGSEELSFVGHRVSGKEDEEVLESDGGEGCPKVWMGLMSLNLPLKNGQNGKS